MLKLAVAALHPYLLPTVLLKNPDQFLDLHWFSISRMASIIRVGEQSGSASELDHRANLGDGVAQRNLARRFVAPALVFGHAFRQALVAEHDAVRNADEVKVGEHHTRAFVAIVEQYLKAGGGEVNVELVHSLAHGGGFVITDGHQRDVEWGDCIRPDDAVGVVILFDRSRNHARHADTVATHGHDHALAGLVETGGVHGLAVLGAELEDMADLDAAADRERAGAVALRLQGWR